MFQVDVSEVWLRNEVTDDAFFPDEDGFFSSLTNVKGADPGYCDWLFLIFFEHEKIIKHFMS